MKEHQRHNDDEWRLYDILTKALEIKVGIASKLRGD